MSQKGFSYLGLALGLSIVGYVFFGVGHHRACPFTGACPLFTYMHSYSWAGVFFSKVFYFLKVNANLDDLNSEYGWWVGLVASLGIVWWQRSLLQRLVIRFHEKV